MSKINLSQIAQPSNPAADKLEIFYDSTLNKLCAVDESGNVAVLGGFATKDYRLIRVVDINQGTTSFAPTAGAKALYVEGIGAGGGGGGVATAITNSGAAGGGGGGAYSAKWITGTLDASYACVVGAKGAGGTAGANNGSVGTDSTFHATPVMTAKGGLGGIADTVAVIHVGGLGGLGGAAASGIGDSLFTGAPGEAGLALAAAQAVSGRGGDSPFGGGGNSLKTQSAGAAATGFGGGGSGGCILSGGASVAGGDGADGLIRVWEFA